MIACYLPVCEQQINCSHLDIPQVPFHSEQHDPAGINSHVCQQIIFIVQCLVFTVILCLVFTCFPIQLEKQQTQTGALGITL